jgi:hypothetical protein
LSIRNIGAELLRSGSRLRPGIQPTRFRHAPRLATVRENFSFAIDEAASSLAAAFSVYRLEWASASGHQLLLFASLTHQVDSFIFRMDAEDEVVSSLGKEL